MHIRSPFVAFLPAGISLAGISLVASFSAGSLEAQDYVVLAAFGKGDPFDAAVTVIATHHKAKVVRFDPNFGYFMLLRPNGPLLLRP